MGKNHIKRINAPKTWDILRKEKVFVTRPNAGRSLSLCVSLNTAMKDLLGKTSTTKESKYLLRYKTVLVNGIRRYDEKFPVGFLDVITFLEEKENYRLLVNEKGKLFMHKISDVDATIKMSKVLNRKQLPKGILQVNCTDGRNFNFKDHAKANEAKINDSLVYTIPTQELKEVLKLQKGSLVYLYKGKHIGLFNVDDFKGNSLVFKVGEELFETKKGYAFVIGKEKPIISFPEAKKEHAKKAKKN